MAQQVEPVQEKQPKQPSTVAVRYGYLGWVGEFRHDPGLVFKYADRVVVKTERGLEIGTPMSVSCRETCPKHVRPEQTAAYVKSSGEEYLQRGAGQIVRVATPEDLAEQGRLDAQAKERMTFCFHEAAKANLSMRMVACEHLLGGERIVFYFTAEGRIDFRQLVRELAREYHTRIEMRQIGSRDEARIVADLEICGRECCCKNFLKVLRPVNMKMAKIQKATLDPTKVSGRCGRLRCCLRYEQQTYEELDANLPNVGTRVRVEQGIGIIRERQVITQLLVLDMGEGRKQAVPLEEIKEILGPASPEEMRPRRQPREASDDSGGGAPLRGGRRDRTDGDRGQGVRRDARRAAQPTNGQEEAGGDVVSPSGRGGEEGDEAAVMTEGERTEAGVEGVAGTGGSAGGSEPRRGRRDRRPGRRRRGRDGRVDNRDASSGQPGQARDASAPGGESAGNVSPPADGQANGSPQPREGQAGQQAERSGRRRRRRRRPRTQ